MKISASYFTAASLAIGLGISIAFNINSHNRLKQTEERLGNLQNSLETVQSELDNLNENIETVQSGLSRTEKEIGVYPENVESLGECVKGVATMMNKLSNEDKAIALLAFSGIANTCIEAEKFIEEESSSSSQGNISICVEALPIPFWMLAMKIAALSFNIFVLVIYINRDLAPSYYILGIKIDINRLINLNTIINNILAQI